MKLRMLSLALVAAVCGCAGAEHQAPKVATSLPVDAQFVHCSDPAMDCFAPAEKACGGKKWSAVAEPNMAFPAIIQESQFSYRMAIVCQ